MWVLLVLLVLIAGSLCEETGNSTATSSGSICNGTFADANATGIFSFNPQAAGVQSFNSTANVSWGVTLYEDAGSSDEYTLWFSTGGSNYSDDSTIGYDVCGIELSNGNTDYGVTNDTARNGVADSGNCLATLDQSCIDALNTLATNTADALVDNPSPGPNSNVTNGVLPTVCNDIGTAIQNNFPKECAQYFGDGGITAWAFPLTDYNNASNAANPTCCSDFQSYSCSLTNPADPNNGLSRYYPITQYYTTVANDSNYDQLVYALTPMMTVFLPIANYLRENSLQQTVSVMSCPHINTFNSGARVPDSLPQADASKKGLSKGAIAGIAVGCVVGVALIAGLGFWLWRRSRQNRSRTESAETPESNVDENATEYPKDEKKVPLPTEEQGTELGSAETTELPAINTRYEMPAADPVELDSEQKRAELSPDSALNELDSKTKDKE